MLPLSLSKSRPYPLNTAGVLLNLSHDSILICCFFRQLSIACRQLPFSPLLSSVGLPPRLILGQLLQGIGAIVSDRCFKLKNSDNNQNTPQKQKSPFHLHILLGIVITAALGIKWCQLSRGMNCLVKVKVDTDTNIDGGTGQTDHTELNATMAMYGTGLCCSSTFTRVLHTYVW